MKISELFTIQFIIGLILGILLIYNIGLEWFISGFKFEYLFYYLVIFFLTLVSTESDSSMMFFMGLGLPFTIIVLLIFLHVDNKHKKEGKEYRKWEL